MSLDGATTLLGILLIVGTGFLFAIYMVFSHSRSRGIGAGERHVMTGDRRELYRSSNGDVWFLARDPANQNAFVVHEPNSASGGQPSRIEVGAFLREDAYGLEHQALLRLTGTLVFPRD
jgi:hypothetical protein